MHLSAWLYGCALLLPWFISWGMTGLVTRELRRRQVLDRPNHRSSHSIPTPRGGGWGLLPPLWLAWAGLATMAGQVDRLWPMLAAAIPLATISWADDVKPVPPAPRFLAQLLAVTAGLAALPEGSLVFQGLLPLPADRLLAGFAWLWFINLYNFMDGIDGLAGSQTACIGGGVALVMLVAGGAGLPAAYGLALAGAALGFLAWNWRPAKVFLGDVGSISLGYLTGWLLLAAAVEGQWAAALLLPLYYLADASLTLLRRLLRGERVWQPHRQHLYQRAVDRGVGHDRVVLAVLTTNAALAALALTATAVPTLTVPTVAAGGLAVGGLLLWLRGKYNGARSTVDMERAP